MAGFTAAKTGGINMTSKTTTAKVIAAVVCFGVTAAVIINKNNNNNSQAIYKKNNKDKANNNGSKDKGGNSSDLSKESEMLESPASDFEYTVENGKVTIAKYIGSDTQVRIPEKIEGKPVTGIYSNAFSYCTSLTSVTIPATVTEIGDDSFSFCTNLTDINVSNDNPLYSSQDGVLFNKDKTTLICYPAGKENTSYSIPNSVTEIGEYSFSYCTSLTNVDIPNSVNEIGIDAFECCTSLTSVDIPNSVTEIGIGAFECCTSLTSVDIPNSVTTISNYAFVGCTSLTSVNIPIGVTEIGEYAFNECSSGLIIKGKAGSAAETCANEGGYTFKNN